jgi:hypothetical protein
LALEAPAEPIAATSDAKSSLAFSGFQEVERDIRCYLQINCERGEYLSHGAKSPLLGLEPEDSIKFYLKSFRSCKGGP